MSANNVKDFIFIRIISCTLAASSNTGILRAAKAIFEAKGHTFDLFVPSDLPLVNIDLMADGFPATVVAWRERAAKADAFLFGTCEYNFSLSAALKNAIDWASIGDNLFKDKPAAIVSAGGGAGGLRAVQHLRDIALFLNLQVMTSNQMQVQVFSQPSPFNSETGDLVSEEQLKKLEGVAEGLIAWTHRLAPR